MPAKLRGVVLGEAEAGGAGFALQDDTSGIYIRSSEATVAQLKPGDFIEVEGNSDPGEFAPFVQLKKFRKLGKRPLPEPRSVTFEEMAAGTLDAQWVEISGIVRVCDVPTRNARKARIELATGGGRLLVRVNQPQIKESLVDGRVRLRGVCYYLVNKNRQVVSPLLAIPGGTSIVVEVAPPSDPYAAPVRAANSILQFTPDGSFGHRVHVRGIVTCQQPNGRFWIRDGETGLAVQTFQSTDLIAGDEVDVLGFPVNGDFSPLLEDAAFRVLSRKTPPKPTPIQHAKMALNHDGDLIEFEAVVTERRPFLDGWTYTLQANDGLVVKALLPLNRNQSPPAESRPGSRISVTGICSLVREYRRTGVASTGLAQPDSFQLLLRDPSDFKLIQPPPWWNRQHLMWLLLGIACASAAATGIVMLFARRRLKEQHTHRLMAEAEFSAMLAERNRIAREIHDTLAQGLGAISMHLELVKDHVAKLPSDAASHLEHAHGLVRSKLAEARAAIWDMRAQILENGDLGAALESVLHQLTSGMDLKTEIMISGRRRRFAPMIENNILRIGQEAIANAAKHARAKHISVALDFTERELHLVVRDDGRGFDSSKPSDSTGSFGLVGMRERAEKLRGSLQINSGAQKGTEIKLSVPISE